MIVSEVGWRHQSMVKLRNYLRVHRRQWHLSQEELAFLFGYTNESIVSRLERQERTITLAVAYTCHLLFGYEPKDIFPALFEQVEASVVSHIHELHERLKQSKPTKKTAAKLKFLQAALARAAEIPQEQEV